MSVLPKSSNASRIAANLDVLTWSLSDEHMRALSSLAHRVSINHAGAMGLGGRVHAWSRA